MHRKAEMCDEETMCQKRCRFLLFLTNILSEQGPPPGKSCDVAAVVILTFSLPLRDFTFKNHPWFKSMFLRMTDHPCY